MRANLAQSSPDSGNAVRDEMIIRNVNATLLKSRSRISTQRYARRCVRSRVTSFITASGVACFVRQLDGIIYLEMKAAFGTSRAKWIGSIACTP